MNNGLYAAVVGVHNNSITYFLRLSTSRAQVTTSRTQESGISVFRKLLFKIHNETLDHRTGAATFHLED